MRDDYSSTASTNKITSRYNSALACLLRRIMQIRTCNIRVIGACVCVRVRVRVRVHVRVRACACVRACVCAREHACVCMCVYLCVSTNIMYSGT